MATLNAQQSTPTGTTVTYAAAAVGGDKFAPGNVEFVVKNSAGTSKTVTIASKACNFGVVHNGGGAVAAGAEVHFGPFPSERFAGSDGFVAVTYSPDATGLTVAVLRH